MQMNCAEMQRHRRNSLFSKMECEKKICTAHQSRYTEFIPRLWPSATALRSDVRTHHLNGSECRRPRSAPCVTVTTSSYGLITSTGPLTVTAFCAPLLGQCILNQNTTHSALQQRNLLSHLPHLLLQALDYVLQIFWPVDVDVATRRSRRRCC